MPLFCRQNRVPTAHRLLFGPSIALWFFVAMALSARAELTLVATSDLVQITNDVQRLSFAKEGDGKFRLTTYVLHGTVWEPLFDAKRPLIEGSRFNLEPTSFTILDDSAQRKLVQFHGSTSSPANVWDFGIEARADSPLIYVQIASHFSSNVNLPTPQPTVALWMNQASAAVVLNQGPPSPTGNVYNVPFNFGFPAAYLWQDNREAAVFFDMTPMTWFSSQGIYRFFNVQIGTLATGTQLGLGMHPRSQSGSTLASGEMLVTFFLYSAWRETQPTQFQALDTLISLYESRHPANSVFPNNTLLGGNVSWEQFAQKGLADMRVNNVTYAELSTSWDDYPLYLMPSVTRMIVHPGRAVASASDAQNAWSFSTVNIHLAPAVLYSRLNPGDTAAAEFVRLKKESLPRFYDSVARMLVSGTRQPVHVFGSELTWQSLMYYAFTWATSEALAPADFNPAIAGRMLMGTEGFIDYAHKVNYLFSTYFNPVTHLPMSFAENSGLGEVREPWSIGSYDYMLLRAWEITKEHRYLQEAQDSLQYFLHSLNYTVNNSYFSATYTEPMQMPVMELMGNGYGAVAAYKLYLSTGDSQYVDISRDFLNTLLRQTFWHEDNIGAVSTDLHNAGLFYPFVGANTATPWETSEANLCLAWLLKQDVENPRYRLMLTLSNLNRINSFYFYPATYTPTVRALNPSLRQDLGQYFPVEELYCLEAPGGSTGSNGTAIYMFGNAVWNWWLYEALAQSSDRAVMVLNTDGIDHQEEAITGAERTLLLFNPNTDTRVFTLLLRSLPSGNYTLRKTAANGAITDLGTFSSAQLTAGVALSLASQDYMRLVVRNVNGTAMLDDIQRVRSTRHQISYAYKLLQERARDAGVDTFLTGLKSQFAACMQEYTASDYTTAHAIATSIIRQLGYQQTSSVASWSIYN